MTKHTRLLRTLIIGVWSMVILDRAEAGTPFHLPEGFDIEQVAGPEQLSYGMCATFDDRGRLFVTESSGSNDPGPKLVENPRSRIRLLEDKDGDGRFESSKIFAEKLSLPMGVLWHQGALFVASPPDLLRFDDVDDDGVADKRTVLLTGWKVLNTASLHGPFLHPDGWLYLTHGRHGYHIVTKEGEPIEGLASRIYRCRPDGTGLERVAGGGFDNPVELAFSAAGEMFCTMTYIVNPLKDLDPSGTRDALIHVVEGGVYPKEHECVKEFKLTGDLLPPMVKFARVSPAGFVRYRSQSFGDAYAGGYFSAHFNSHAVRVHRLTPAGASYIATDEDFLSSDDPNFHPTDVVEDADGSLLVVDTGGWYLQACPLSRVAKHDVRGGIYRVRRKDALKTDDPRGLSLKMSALPAAECVRLLDDVRFAVRDRATELLVRAGPTAVEPLRQLYRSAWSAQTRLASLWCLARIGSPEAMDQIRTVLDDREEEVRLAAAHALGMTLDRRAIADLEKRLLEDPSQHVRRACAAALGRLAESGSAASLLRALDSEPKPDRFLDHAIMQALFACAKAETIADIIYHGTPARQRAAILAIEQVYPGIVPRGAILNLIGSDDAELRKVVLWAVSRHPEWAAAILGYLTEALRAGSLPPTERDAIRSLLLASAADERIVAMVAELMQSPTTLEDRIILLLEVLTGFPGEKLPASWSNALGHVLIDKRSSVLLAAIAVIRGRKLAGFDEALLSIARDTGQSSGLRLDALAVCCVRLPQIDASQMDLLTDHLRPEVPPIQRLLAAQAVASCHLTEEQRNRLLEYVTAGDPLLGGTLLNAFAHSGGATLGAALVRKLQEFQGLADPLSKGRLDALLASYPQEVKEAARPLYVAAEQVEEARQRTLQDFLPALKDGDAARGRAVFFSNAAGCSVCHQVGRDGGRVGPDLTRIGLVRAGRDILESILFPSASFAQGYEPYIIETNDGDLVNGVVADQTTDAVIMRCTGDIEIRVNRKSIKEIRPSQVSLMPQGLEKSANPQQFKDLLAYLQSLK